MSSNPYIQKQPGDIMLATEDVIDMSSFHKARAIVAKYGVSLDS